MKVLVTGASGFLGSHLVEMLSARGDEVCALVQPGQKAAWLRALPGVEIVQGDITDISSLKSAVPGCERVYHLAARTGPWGAEAVYHAVNVQGTENVIMAAMEAGVQRIVHTSSITVYGHHPRGLVTEDNPYHAEDNPYSRTKIEGEQLAFKLVRERGAPVVVVRPAWIYGPRDLASFGRFVALVHSGKGFLLGRGDNQVPVVYVRDVARGLLLAGDAGQQVVGRAYTLAGAQAVTQAAYLNAIADALQVPHITRCYPFSWLYGAGRGTELLWKLIDRSRRTPPPLTTYGISLLGRDQRFSIERARQELGYAPGFDLTKGVSAGVAWYLNQDSYTVTPEQRVSLV